MFEIYYEYDFVIDITLVEGALDEDDQPHNKREGEDEDGWVVDDHICTDGGTVLGSLMHQKYNPRIIRVEFGTLTTPTSNDR